MDAGAVPSEGSYAGKFPHARRFLHRFGCAQETRHQDATAAAYARQYGRLERGYGDSDGVRSWAVAVRGPLFAVFDRDVRAACVLPADGKGDRHVQDQQGVLVRVGAQVKRPLSPQWSFHR